MKKLLFAITLVLCLTSVYASKPKYKYVSFKTDQGECIVKLYNETPEHRDNFLRLTKRKFYDGTLFHRVIKNFMIQGGDPDSKKAEKGKLLGEGDVGYTICPEFNDSLFHKKGVLAAARDDNPEKASSGCQFYLVQGKIFTEEQLDAVETKRLKHKIPQWQREVYKTIGGAPHLDGNYTVYGEVVKGLDMIDKISVTPIDSNNRPLTDVKMTVTILKRRAAKKLEKSLNSNKVSIGNQGQIPWIYSTNYPMTYKTLEQILQEQLKFVGLDDLSPVFVAFPPFDCRKRP